ncbi:MAG: hypothetical protein GY754_27030 [bacterium]|nr:hypothetical protein [bacterium]
MKKYLMLIFILFLSLGLTGAICGDDEEEEGDVPDISGIWSYSSSVSSGTWLITQSGNQMTVSFGTTMTITGEVSESSIAVTQVFSSGDTLLYTLNKESDTRYSGTAIVGTDSVTIVMTKTSSSTTIPTMDLSTLSSVTADGDSSEWSSVTSSFTDSTGESGVISGSDIEEVKIAKKDDGTMLYALIKLTANAVQTATYNVCLKNYSSSSGLSSENLIFGIYYDSGWYQEYDGDGNSSTSCYTPTGVTYIELSIPLSGGSYLVNNSETLGAQFIIAVQTSPAASGADYDEAEYFGVVNF